MEKIVYIVRNKPYQRLRARIVEYYGDIKSFCVSNGLSYSTLCATLANRLDWRKSQMDAIARPLEIPREEYWRYFWEADDEKD